MPNEVKQRKKSQPQKSSDDTPETAADGPGEAHAVKAVSGHASGGEHKSSVLDFKGVLCLLSLTACGVLSWVVLQQNERFSDIEEKFQLLHKKTSPLIAMEHDIQTVSKQLAASEDDLQVALSSVSMASRLQQDISTLHAAVMAIQADEKSASGDLQEVNAHFLNVTETWQQRLGVINSDLVALKSESRDAHSEATEKVNEAERRVKSLEERLEELEDSTKRNARAMVRTEEDDVKKAQDHLDWNTKQIQKLNDQISSLAQKESELSSQLQEHIPKAEECEQHLPKVEEAIRSIVRLASDLSGTEKRLEELTLQVFGSEDSMLKAVNEILQLRQELDTLHAKNSILKMKDELSVVKEAVRELTLVLRQNHDENQGESASQVEEEEWTHEEDEPWENEEEPLLIDEIMQCESVRLKLEGLGAQKGLESGLKRLEQETMQLKDWSSGLSEKQSQLQTSLTTLRAAVRQIEERTSAIAKDFTSKVSSVRTDVRRMDGLRSELESLLSQVGELEDKASQVERTMVKRIGDVLANSIDRVSSLRSSSERNSQAIEQLQRRIPELVSADRKLAERLRELESGRAKVIRTVTFASDLKPKVFTIKRDFGALEPQLVDLTLRIGQLAEDLTKREQEIVELRQTLTNLTTVESELGQAARQVSQIIDSSDQCKNHG
ncbi:inhibitor of nuclear factor kappa-B kinase-interacting protein [Eucyclogobius newberryi]|uniref:inhibitor of nuclear factor kappa-B kinase-interacting protein n=1 Tax=Eucyclogobius newberryi TaxID=166745 RepID=UPI003B58ED48